MALVSIWIFVGHLVVKATIGKYVLGCVSLYVLCALYALFVPCVVLCVFMTCVGFLNEFL